MRLNAAILPVVPFDEVVENTKEIQQRNDTPVLFQKNTNNSESQLGTTIPTCDTNPNFGHQSQPGITIPTWGHNPNVGRESQLWTTRCLNPNLGHQSSLRVTTQTWCLHPKLIVSVTTQTLTVL
mmetsp:Transcript_25117/g.41188  ORF Transcript_25117/g.41188 Transcript_25117/m.41188 type:complete len:124 (+) Transcript_25117:682-1053(+)